MPPPPITYKDRGRQPRQSSAPLIPSVGAYNRSPSPPRHSSQDDLVSYGQGSPEPEAAQDDDSMADAQPTSAEQTIVFTVNPKFDNTLTTDNVYSTADNLPYPFSAGLPTQGGPYFDSSDPRWSTPTITLDRKSYVTGRFTDSGGDKYILGNQAMKKRNKGVDPPFVHLAPPIFAHPAMHPEVIRNCVPFLTPVSEFPTESSIYPIFDSAKATPSPDVEAHMEDAPPFWASCRFPCKKCDEPTYPDSPLKLPRYCAITFFPLEDGDSSGAPPNARKIKCQGFVYKGVNFTVELYALFFDNVADHPDDPFDMLWWNGKDGKPKAPPKPSKKRRQSGSVAGSKKKAKVKVDEPDTDFDEDIKDPDVEDVDELQSQAGLQAPDITMDINKPAADDGGAGPSQLGCAGSPRADSVGDEAAVDDWMKHISNHTPSEILDYSHDEPGDFGMQDPPASEAGAAGIATADSEHDKAHEPAANIPGKVILVDHEAEAEADTDLLGEPVMPDAQPLLDPPQKAQDQEGTQGQAVGAAGKNVTAVDGVDGVAPAGGSSAPPSTQLADWAAGLTSEQARHLSITANIRQQFAGFVAAAEEACAAGVVANEAEHKLATEKAQQDYIEAQQEMETAKTRMREAETIIVSGEGIRDEKNKALYAARDAELHKLQKEEADMVAALTKRR
ncbi:hypothetical protein Q8F55_001752 [Vanrija albida]|uniref:GDP/GTP exchange factor Sec2 N-terminal domain-containing protein n=1 Tax=Vanrija albida TaxID=181172 RepID=A0ABR3Q7W5_9TREE